MINESGSSETSKDWGGRESGSLRKLGLLECRNLKFYIGVRLIMM